MRFSFSWVIAAVLLFIIISIVHGAYTIAQTDVMDDNCWEASTCSSSSTP